MTTTPAPIAFDAEAEAALEEITGTLVVFADGTGALHGAAAALDERMGGTLARAAGHESFKARRGRPSPLPGPRASRPTG
jgi:hypothetical protein